MGQFAKVAPYLGNPLVLVGFCLLLLFGTHRALLEAGLLRQLSQKQSSTVVRLLLKYGFQVAIVTVVLGFAHAGFRYYNDVLKHSGQGSLIQQTGASTTTGPNSPAVTGNNNKITYEQPIANVKTPPPTPPSRKQPNALPSQDNSVHVDNGSKIEQQSSGDCSPNFVGGNNSVNCNPPRVRSMVVSYYIECHLREGYKAPEPVALTDLSIGSGAFFEGLGHPAALHSRGVVTQIGSDGDLVTYEQQFNHDDTGGLIGLPVEELSKLTATSIVPFFGFTPWCSQMDKDRITISVNDQLVIKIEGTPPSGALIMPEFRDPERRHPTGLPSLKIGFKLSPDALANIK